MNNLIWIIIFLIFALILILLFTKIRWSKGNIKFRIAPFIYRGFIKIKNSKTKLNINKKECMEGLNLLHDILTRHGIFFWLSEGTALGFRRSRDFIDYDDDVDIGILEKDKDKLIYALNELKDNGFVFCGKWRRTPYMFYRNGEAYDIDITTKGGHCAANLGKCDKIIPHLQSFTPIIINGRDYYIPQDSYFKELYGSDWHIPIRGKKPDRE